MSENSNSDEAQILFKITSEKARRGDGVAKITFLQRPNPRAAGGTPGLPPRVPPKPPTRSIISGYMERVEVDGEDVLRLVVEVQAGGDY